MKDEKSIPDHRQKEDDQTWWQRPFLMFLRLSAWVAVPVVIATFVGNYLDEKYDSAPFGLISIVGFSFLISMFGLIKEASKEYKKINEENKKKHNA